MKAEIIEKLNGSMSDKGFYVSKGLGDGVLLYFSHFDFITQESLFEKDIISLLIEDKPNKKRIVLKVSEEFILFIPIDEIFNILTNELTLINK